MTKPSTLLSPLERTAYRWAERLHTGALLGAGATGAWLGVAVQRHNGAWGTALGAACAACAIAVEQSKLIHAKLAARAEERYFHET